MLPQKGVKGLQKVTKPRREAHDSGLRLRMCRLRLPSPPRCPPQAQTAHGRRTPGAGHAGQDSGSSPTAAAVPVRQMGQELHQE